MITPELALDFTAASLDSRVTFTRTTGASNPATYVNSSGYITAATNNEPRFDYDPVTLVCKGLLIEESRANICLKSEDFTTTWSMISAGTSSPSAVADQATSPDGTVNADQVTFGAISGTTQYSLMRQAITVSATTYTASIYARAKDSGEVGKTLFFYFNSGTPTVIPVVLSLEWVRVTSPQLAVAGTGYVTIGTGGSGIFPSGVNQSAAVAYIWGAQLEAGAFATSYIPTTTTAVTRNADVATITGSNFSDFWQASKGGAQVVAIPSTVSGTRPLVQFDDGTANEIIALQGNAANPELYIVDGGTPQVQLDAGTITANASHTLTGWWDTNDCRARYDSGATVTDQTATIPTVTQMRIGSDGTNYLNGHIATIGYYDRFSGQVYSRRKNKAVFKLL